MLESNKQLRRWIIITLISLFIFGSLHHIDHIVRGNHIGWPIIPKTNAFTYSLMVYPLFALGLSALFRGRIWAAYWFAYGIATFFGIFIPHFVPPFIAEPIHDIYLPYLDPMATDTFALAPETHLAWFQKTFTPISGNILAVVAISVLISALTSAIMLVIVSLRVRKTQGHW